MKEYNADRSNLMEPLSGLCEPPDWQTSIYLKSEVDKEIKRLKSLISKVFKAICKYDISDKLLEAMQQALKEE